MAEGDDVGEGLKVHLPYACPTCGHSVVFKRILTVEEAAYVAGMKDAAFRQLIRKRQVRFKYLTNNGTWRRPVRVIDSVDLLEYLRTKYQYPDEIDPTSTAGRWIERKRLQGVHATATWNRNRAARIAARVAKQQASDTQETGDQNQEAPTVQQSDARESGE